MAGFHFPPPPPPPPRATANDAPDQYASQRGRPHTGRGGRGQGWQGRGRGNNNRGNGRGGRGNAPQQRPRGGGYITSERGGHQQQHAPPSQGNYHVSGVGAYTNTAPTIQGQQYGGQTQPQVDPAAFAQAMSFMSTPAGMQTFAAFANNMANGGQVPHVQQSPQQQHQGRLGSPETGKKRKRGDQNAGGRPAHSSTSIQSPSSKPKPPRAKAVPPPAVPSFGFSLPTAPTSTVSNGTKNAANKAVKGKQKIRLGLTIEDDDDEEEEGPKSDVEEDFEDEEATLAATLRTEGVSFEHNGVIISLQTSAEVADWIRDRRKQYPTRKRVAEKEQEKAERREHELEFLRRVQGRKKREPRQREIDTSRSTASQEDATRPKKPDLEALRAKVEASRIANKREAETAGQAQMNPKPAIMDLGLGYDSDTESDDDILMEESSVVSSSSEESSDDESDSDSDSAPEEQSSKIEVDPISVPPADPDSDSDSGPEEQSSKVEVARPVVAPPPAPTPLQSAPGPKAVRKDSECYHWRKKGWCNAKKCQFTHTPKEEDRPMSLFERLVEQEREKADRVALEAIKWLGQNGFLG